ncbi:hypothetical protein [Streptomyces sp. CBMA123]|uniref:hypothetical protein n=1 Tax=Streptomyces sp. CBMA123 TaxID=1896313 RepID=UPI001661F9B7|nr:hypothetical protein [Streptomyces sp. CBMA123]MBD0695536.1 hypothetical protein [Streptomyces sp. CBMA123]
MANDQSETPVPSTPGNGTKTEAPATAVEAGKAVEGAVTASSNTSEYAAPSDAQKTAIENDLFGGEGAEDPNAPATGEPGKTYEPENIIFGHP